MRPAIALAAALAALILAAPPPLGARDDTRGDLREDVLLRDDFTDLLRWMPRTFQDIERHTAYTIETVQGGYALRAASNASASGLTMTRTWDVHRFPRLRFRWKVDGVYAAGDATRKDGDDFPLRVYVVFGWEGESMDLGDVVAYRVAKLFSDEAPPHSALTYVWANRAHGRDVIPSAYTSRSMLVPLRHGAEQAGTWFVEDRDVLADYRRAFDRAPPATATLAVMNDSDNTGEAAVSWLDFVEIYALVE